MTDVSFPPNPEHKFSFGPTVGKFSAQGSQKLLAHTFDRATISHKKLPYERLDQLTVDILTSVR